MAGSGRIGRMNVLAVTLLLLLPRESSAAATAAAQKSKSNRSHFDGTIGRRRHRGSIRKQPRRQHGLSRDNATTSGKLQENDDVQLLSLRFLRGGEGSERQRRLLSTPLFFASAMACLAGCSNTICFRQFQCYATMMTGNLVLLSISLAEKNWKDAVRRLSYVASYLAGAGVARIVELACRQRAKDSSGQYSNQHLTIVSDLVVVVFALAQWAIAKTADPSIASGGLKLNLVLLAFGYGIIYSSASQLLNGTICQLMTGHVTRVGVSAADKLKNGVWPRGIEFSICIPISFVTGGILGICWQHIVGRSTFPYFLVLSLFYATMLRLQ